MVTGTMPRDPRWEYSSGRSAMRQMLAASSRITTIGGSSLPASSFGLPPARPHDGVGQRGDQRRRRRPGFGQQVQGVAAGRERRRVEGRQAPGRRGGVTQAMMSSSLRHFAAVRAVW